MNAITQVRDQEMQMVPVKLSVMDSIVGERAFGTVMERLVNAVNRVRTLDRTTDTKTEAEAAAEAKYAALQREMMALIDPDNVTGAKALTRMTEVALEIKKASTALISAREKANGSNQERVSLIGAIKLLALDLEEEA